MTSRNCIEYHSFTINRKNGGKLSTNIKVKSVLALKITRVIYDGEDFNKGHLFRFLMSNFIKGYHHINSSLYKPYTLICFTNETGEWYSADTEWDWEGRVMGDALESIICTSWIDNIVMRDVNITVEIKILTA